MEMIALFRERHPELVAQSRRPTTGSSATRTAAAVDPQQAKLERVLGYMLDEKEFLGPLRHPLALALSPRSPVRVPGRRPGLRCSTCRRVEHGMFGGNSNWRGPVWMPVNVLIVRALLNLYASTATTSRSSARPDRARDDLFEVAQEISAALAHVPARRERHAAGLRRHAKFQTIRTGAT
jgi:hypothetical protein